MEPTTTTTISSTSGEPEETERVYVFSIKKFVPEVRFHRFRLLFRYMGTNGLAMVDACQAVKVPFPSTSKMTMMEGTTFYFFAC